MHPTSIIAEGAKLGKNVKVGPYCIIGPEVILHDNVELKSHVVIEGITEIGESTVIYPFASIGQPPQILKYNNELSNTIIGSNNIIREYVTVQAGSQGGGMITSIGNNNLFMVGVHIGHDCKIGNNVVFANYVSLAGHIEVEDYVIIGGLSAVHQYARIGKYAMIGGLSPVGADVIPFGLASGKRAVLEGLNLIGMNRKEFDKAESLNALKIVQEIFLGEGNFADRIKQAQEKYKNNSIVMQIIDFLEQGSNRSFCSFEKTMSLRGELQSNLTKQPN
ncbi:acyl-ACP--UDP-N-acetylglucosamine O-acyltransferase [Rickettsia endosymbiont of Lasioglossum villosulum]|uniref:acyl-ACP--UDP-N-acetylglucosamine O-acyltransferase n=1 Tax=Rickettsia endosymbiont of Lasioglossum villosulum TaxID=3066269 RepID=UPI00397BC05F